MRSEIKKLIARVRMTRFTGYSQDILDARKLADHIEELEAMQQDIDALKTDYAKLLKRDTTNLQNMIKLLALLENDDD